MGFTFVATAKNPSKSKRHRGYILTPAGAKKFKTRISELEAKTGIKYNPNKIAEQAQLISSQGLHPTTIRKILRRTSGCDESSLRLIFQVLEMELEDPDYTQPGIEELVTVDGDRDWGEAVDVSVFYGRESELESLAQWILEENCRLVTLLGMGGIGKTSLSVKLGQQLQEQFQFTIWRSLRNAPALDELLSQLLSFLAKTGDAAGELVKTNSYQISQLIDYLRQHRCLLILDNVETILKQGSPAGQYRKDYEDYGELFRRIAETAHQSCLVLTSREKPQSIAAFEGELLPIRCWQLNGLSDREVAQIFTSKGLDCSQSQIEQLTRLYGGNPLALKIVASSIQQLFAGNIEEFINQNIAVFNGIRNLLTEQFDRLSPLEKQIIYWLAINREPVNINQLREDIIPLISPGRLLETLEYIGWRSLIETKTNLAGGFQQFTLQPVVMEYVNDRLLEEVCEEIYQTSQSKGNIAHLNLFKYLALIKAESQDYIRNSQIKLILDPLAQKLLTVFGSQENLISVLTDILASFRSQKSSIPGYVAGNILNLLVHLQTDLTGKDLSQLTILQAYLQGVNLRGLNFTKSHFAKSVFSETFSNIYGIALSPDGSILATGHANGEVRFWQVADAKLLCQNKAHHGTVWSLAFSADGKMLASGSFDRTIVIWDVNLGQIKQTLEGHEDWVWSVAFSPDRQLLASSSSDRAIKLWDLDTARCITISQAHHDLIDTVNFSPDGKLLASGSADGTIKIWDVQKAEISSILLGHTNQISAVTFSPDGLTLASCEAQVIKLWNLANGECYQSIEDELTFVWSIAFTVDGKSLIIGNGKAIEFWDIKTAEYYQVLSGYTSQVWSIALSANGNAIAGSDKQILKIWQIGQDQTYYPLKTIQGYTNSVFAVAFNPDGKTFACAGNNQTISLWDVATQNCQIIATRHEKAIRALAFSPDGKLMASSSEDKTIWLWEKETKKSIFHLIGHTGCVWSVAFDPENKILASASADRTIRLWNLSENLTSRTLLGHESWVLSVAFSPDGKLLASSSADQTIRLWDTATGECVKTLVGHRGLIWSICFSKDGKSLASASEDGTVKLWNIQTGECDRNLSGHQSLVWSVTFNPQHQLLASSSIDQTIRIWDIITGQCIQVLEGHHSSVWSVAFSPDGQILLSGSHDETIKLWQIKAETSKCVATLRPARIYEEMNISGVTGLTEAQKGTLRSLGAFDR
ncbi:MAG TPA: NB-ARC domain-containing protein [Leptolyngbyaceae cyanobacterium]